MSGRSDRNVVAHRSDLSSVGCFPLRHEVKATDLFVVDEGPRARSFRLHLLAAIGQSVLATGCGLAADEHQSRLGKARIWFNWEPNGSSEKYPTTAAHVDVELRQAKATGGGGWAPASAVVLMEYPGCPSHPMMPRFRQIVVQFPDRLLGLEKLYAHNSPSGVTDDVSGAGRTALKDSRYRGLYFNLTPGDTDSNLFDVIDAVCRAETLIDAAIQLEYPARKAS